MRNSGVKITFVVVFTPFIFMSKTNTKYTSQHIDNQSFDDGLQVRITELIGADGILKNPATEEKQDTIVTALGESAITATSVDASSSGDNTIVSITNIPKLYYICLSANGANSADVTAIVKIGATTKYKVSLKAGAIWARNIGAEKRYVTGIAGDDIIVNLSAAQTVHVSVEYAD